jgi:hypothetical protein
MVNENNFQFDRKSLFNFLKTIYDFEICKSFSGFKLFILAHTFVGIRHRRALKFVGSPNLLSMVLKFWYSIAEIRQHWLDSGDITVIRQPPREFDKS